MQWHQHLHRISCATDKAAWQTPKTKMHRFAIKCGFLFLFLTALVNTWFTHNTTVKVIIAHANLRNAVSVYLWKAGFCQSINTVIYNMITSVSTNIFTSGKGRPRNGQSKCFGFIQALLKENKWTPHSSDPYNRHDYLICSVFHRGNVMTEFRWHLCVLNICLVMHSEWWKVWKKVHVVLRMSCRCAKSFE